MAAEIADDATAERPPAAPTGREIAGVVGAFRSRAEPLIPIERGRNWRGFHWAFLRSVSTVEPDMGFANFADPALPNQLGAAA